MTVALIRTGTRGSSSWPGDASPPEAEYIYADCTLAKTILLQSRGGPYITTHNPATLRLLAISRFCANEKTRGRCSGTFAYVDDDMAQPQARKIYAL